MNLREQVDRLLPGWESWYPSLFDAAQDLGLIRARVCAPSSLMLSNRHAGIYSEAVQAFREKWSAEEEPPPEAPAGTHKRNKHRQRRNAHAPPADLPFDLGLDIESPLD